MEHYCDTSQRDWYLIMVWQPILPKNFTQGVNKVIPLWIQRASQQCEVTMHRRNGSGIKELAVTHNKSAIALLRGLRRLVSSVLARLKSLICMPRDAFWARTTSKLIEILNGRI